MKLLRRIMVNELLFYLLVDFAFVFKSRHELNFLSNRNTFLMICFN